MPWSSRKWTSGWELIIENPKGVCFGPKIQGSVSSTNCETDGMSKPVVSWHISPSTPWNQEICQHVFLVSSLYQCTAGSWYRGFMVSYTPSLDSTATPPWYQVTYQHGFIVGQLEADGYGDSRKLIVKWFHGFVVSISGTSKWQWFRGFMVSRFCTLHSTPLLTARSW